MKEFATTVFLLAMSVFFFVLSVIEDDDEQ